MQPFRFKPLLSTTLLLATACDPQTGEEYLGEVLLEVQGRVLLRGQPQPDAAPMLVFDAGGQLSVVRGTVEGVFPSDFRLTFTEPPPPQAFEDGVAAGFLVFTADSQLPAAEQPDWRSDFERACGALPLGESCAFTQVVCPQSGPCRERDISCQARECELVESRGDASVLTTTRGDTEPPELLISSRSCAGEACFSVGQACNPLDECYAELRRCEPVQWALEYYEPLTFSPTRPSLSCTVLAERGDAPVLELAALVTKSSNNYVFLYLSEDATLPSYLVDDVDEPGALRPGYNVLEYSPLDGHALFDLSECAQDAAFRARDEYNAEHGTSYAYSDPAVPADVRTELLERTFQKGAACVQALDPILRVVPDPANAELEIQIGAPPKL